MSFECLDCGIDLEGEEQYIEHTLLNPGCHVAMKVPRVPSQTSRSGTGPKMKAGRWNGKVPLVGVCNICGYRTEDPLAYAHHAKMHDPSG